MPVDLLVMLVMIHNVSYWAVQREGGQKFFFFYKCGLSSDDCCQRVKVEAPPDPASIEDVAGVYDLYSTGSGSGSASGGGILCFVSSDRSSYSDNGL